MALNIGEAHAVNALLRWVFRADPPNVAPDVAEKAFDAATILANRAYKALSAGLTSLDVGREFPRPVEAEPPADSVEISGVKFEVFERTTDELVVRIRTGRLRGVPYVFLRDELGALAAWLNAHAEAGER